MIRAAAVVHRHLTTSRSQEAQASRLGWSVSLPCRHAAKGATHRKRFLVPLRSSASSSWVTAPGCGGRGRRGALVWGGVPASKQTSGRLGAYGRGYTSTTSAMAPTTAALCAGGSHPGWFNQGLGSFCQRRAHGFCGTRGAKVQCNQFVRHQLHRPAFPPSGQLRAGQVPEARWAACQARSVGVHPPATHDGRASACGCGRSRCGPRRPDRGVLLVFA